MFLSLVGLRFTDTLFFYISPAWWFVWLMLQLYLVFPVLYYFLKRLGIFWFLGGTVAFTIVSRYLGMEGIRYSSSLYYWQTGIFFGTRLAEFAFGMALAVYFWQKKQDHENFFSSSLILLGAIPAFIIGLLCTFNRAGLLVSHLLISIGMAGCFYVTWVMIFRKILVSKQLLIWLGIQSYSIYLVHQPPLKLTTIFFKNLPEYHLAAAIIVLLISVPAGWLLSQVIGKVLSTGKKFIGNHKFDLISLIVASVSLAALIFMEPRIGIYDRGFSLFLGISLLFLIYVEFYAVEDGNPIWQSFRSAAILTILFKLFLFHTQLGTMISTFLGFSYSSISIGFAVLR